MADAIATEYQGFRLKSDPGPCFYLPEGDYFVCDASFCPRAWDIVKNLGYSDGLYANASTGQAFFVTGTGGGSRVFEARSLKTDPVVASSGKDLYESCHDRVALNTPQNNLAIIPKSLFGEDARPRDIVARGNTAFFVVGGFSKRMAVTTSPSSFDKWPTRPREIEEIQTHRRIGREATEALFDTLDRHREMFECF